MATVTVRGQAELDVPPDRVRLSVAVQAEAVTGAEALALVAERSAATDAVLDRAGDLVLLRRPAAVTLGQQWPQDGRSVTGHQARRTVLVEARAAGPLGELLRRRDAGRGRGVQEQRRREPVLELLPQPVPVGTSVEVRYALLQ